MAAADWNSLPCDLAQLIANKFSVVEDFLMLACVSRNFRSSLKRDKWRPLDKVSQPPWLLLGCPEKYFLYDGETSALSMYNKKRIPVNQPQLRGSHIFGTSCGWILFLGLDFRWHLFNPLTQRHVALPPPGSKDCIFMERAILIKRPPTFRFDDFIVVAIGIIGELSVFRPEKKTWETVQLSIARIGVSCDITHYNCRIYVISSSGDISIFSNVEGPGPLIEVEYVPGLLPISAATNRMYSVVSLRDLLLITRFHDEVLNKTHAFRVFKFNPQTKKLTVVKNLGERSLFLGDCQSISLSSPETFNCKSNCIYFNNHNISPRSSGKELPDTLMMGVFDLKTRTIQPFFEGAQSLAGSSASTWFIPMVS